MTGRSPSGRAGRPADQAPTGLGDTATIPSAARIAEMLSREQRAAVLALGPLPSRLGCKSGSETYWRLAAIKSCPYPLFQRTWGFDAGRYNLTALGLDVRAELERHPLDGPMSGDVGSQEAGA